MIHGSAIRRNCFLASFLKVTLIRSPPPITRSSTIELRSSTIEVMAITRSSTIELRSSTIEVVVITSSTTIELRSSTVELQNTPISFFFRAHNSFFGFKSTMSQSDQSATCSSQVEVDLRSELASVKRDLKRSRTKEINLVKTVEAQRRRLNGFVDQYYMSHTKAMQIDLSRSRLAKENRAIEYIDTHMVPIKTFQQLFTESCEDYLKRKSKNELFQLFCDLGGMFETLIVDFAKNIHGLFFFSRPLVSFETTSNLKAGRDYRQLQLNAKFAGEPPPPRPDHHRICELITTRTVEDQERVSQFFVRKWNSYQEDVIVRKLVAWFKDYILMSTAMGGIHEGFKYNMETLDEFPLHALCGKLSNPLPRLTPPAEGFSISYELETWEKKEKETFVGLF